MLYSRIVEAGTFIRRANLEGHIVKGRSVLCWEEGFGNSAASTPFCLKMLWSVACEVTYGNLVE